VTIKATVASDSSTDPSPGDNTVIETTELGILRVAGGGLGCSTSQSGSASGLSALATAALLSLLGVLRLRRRSKSSH
jgi:MYXO-CTERM domain-containing protein